MTVGAKDFLPKGVVAFVSFCKLFFPILSPKGGWGKSVRKNLRRGNDGKKVLQTCYSLLKRPSKAAAFFRSSPVFRKA